MDFSDLRNKLEQFSVQDYATGRPFEFLRDYVQNHLIRYIQFLPIVMEDGESKGVDKDALEWLTAGEQRKMSWAITSCGG